MAGGEVYRTAAMLALLLTLLLPPTPTTSPTTAPSPERVVPFGLVEADLDAREVRLPAEVLVLDVPLEFVCVVAGTADHESLLRTRARPSDLHTALLTIGFEPGKPVRWSDAEQRFLPPTGPAVELLIRRPGEADVPAEAWIEAIETGEPMPRQAWVFTGGVASEAGGYEADATGHVASLVNFESSVLDVPYRASDSNDELNWHTNPDVAAPDGTFVTLVIRPKEQG